METPFNIMAKKTKKPSYFRYPTMIGKIVVNDQGVRVYRIVPAPKYVPTYLPYKD